MQSPEARRTWLRDLLEDFALIQERHAMVAAKSESGDGRRGQDPDRLGKERPQCLVVDLMWLEGDLGFWFEKGWGSH